MLKLLLSDNFCIEKETKRLLYAQVTEKYLLGWGNNPPSRRYFVSFCFSRKGAIT